MKNRKNRKITNTTEYAFLRGGSFSSKGNDPRYFLQAASRIRDIPDDRLNVCFRIVLIPRKGGELES